MLLASRGSHSLNFQLVLKTWADPRKHSGWSNNAGAIPRAQSVEPVYQRRDVTDLAKGFEQAKRTAYEPTDWRHRAVCVRGEWPVQRLNARLKLLVSENPSRYAISVIDIAEFSM